MAIITVDMGEMALTCAADTGLQACGLGACVGLCLYESDLRLAVLVHVVLPAALPPSRPARPAAARPPLPGKCADTAVAHALAEVARHGGETENLRAALVGGARIFTPAAEDAPLSRLEIGRRSVYALKEALMQAGIPLWAEDTGGHFGRTVTLDAATGEVRVRPLGLSERRLTTLGQRSVAPAGEAREGVMAYAN